MLNAEYEYANVSHWWSDSFTGSKQLQFPFQSHQKQLANKLGGIGDLKMVKETATERSWDGGLRGGHGENQSRMEEEGGEAGGHGAWLE